MILFALDSYLNVVNIVFTILFFIMTLIVLHFAIIAIAGIFAKKKYPESNVFNRYGCIIPARNEENTVADLITSIRKTKYPQDKLDIFVIAHNCTDNTAKIAREAGAIVYEYNNPNECTMGYAFKYLFSCIEKDYKTSSYDGFFLFNADNIVANDYFNKMNDAFNYYDKKYIITSFRNSRNFNSNVMAGLYGIYFTIGSRLESRGRTALNISTRVQGTGYVVNSDFVKDGWKYVTLTEDWELSADQVLAGNQIKYCDAAVFYDEQPTNFKIMWRQRVRWSRGHLLVFFTRMKDLLSSLFIPKKHKSFSIYDTTVNCSPYCLALVFLFVAKIICLLLAPLSDLSMPVGEVYKQVFLGVSGVNNPFAFDFNTMSFTSDGYLFELIRNAAIGYVSTALVAVLTFIIEHKRIGKMNFFLKVAICLLWPLFVFIQFPIDVQAIMSKNLGWKPIPHGDKKSKKA